MRHAVRVCQRAVRTDRAPWHLAGSHAVDEKTDIQNMTAGLTAIAEVVRLGRMHPAGPKRTKITLGGWSDFARLGSVPNAQKAAALAAKMVQFTLRTQTLTPAHEAARGNGASAAASSRRGGRGRARGGHVHARRNHLRV